MGGGGSPAPHHAPTDIGTNDDWNGPAPTDLPDIDPSFPVMGSWVDLDVEEPTTRLDSPAESTRRRRSVDETPHTPAPTDEELGPFGAAVFRAFELVKGDSYYPFLVGALLIIFILVAMLLAFSEPG